MFDFLVYLAVVGSLIAALAYIRSMFRGQTNPNRVTWLMWCIAPFVATAASLSNETSLAVLPVFMAGFGPFLIFTASFFNKKAYWKYSLRDYLCGALSASALILWYVTNNPNVAIVFSIISDASAAIPTLIKAWYDPKTESAWPYMVGTFAPMTSFLVVSYWSFSELAFPSYLIVINILLSFPLIRSRCHR